MTRTEREHLQNYRIFLAVEACIIYGYFSLTDDERALVDDLEF
jgi:L-rhamnose mutarotase